MDVYKVIGLMSGTSLDGVDIAYCSFELTQNEWSYKVRIAETIPYSPLWRSKLEGVASGNALQLATTDAEYGSYLGGLVKAFVNKHAVEVDFISSHGHTIFHQPD